MPKRVFIFFLLIQSTFCIYSQNRFQTEVNSIQKKYETLWNKNKETIVFTGSSSIRLWKNLDSIFPNKQIINTGFGASLSGDLLHFTDELIIKYNPTKVFIYEGDNDIAYDKTPKEILKNLIAIIEKIKKSNKEIDVILISAKPSINRWHLKKKYKRFNRKLKRITKKESDIHFVDVWKPMLKGKKINTDLFSPDGLHMNPQGYKIWYMAIKQHLN
ncbi:GDSL-type esterase/lipase family protein [uncultured Maribacter sp.]|uniref:GDSL-type esterase/lipase family protein n=1 Tax=uncultured Maribacter sp. TaxID=431308 RepID=UPI0026240B36|nr:GDSL-type esterase/lipase family protein [uncultured Maribacter sp.]